MVLSTSLLMIPMVCGLEVEDEKLFYFDDSLKKHETEYSWDKALIYLENLFLNQPSSEKLNSLVGFSWYYLIEGPIDSGKYDKDENLIALDIWKKYLSIGLREYSNDPHFCFVAGYSILMHGFYIEEYKNNYEQVGVNLLNCAKVFNEPKLKEVVNIILEYQEQKKYKILKVKQETLNMLFSNDSLLENYFKKLYV